MITTRRYKQLKARIAKFDKWLNGRTSYSPHEVPKRIPRVSNDMRSQVEVYEFVQHQPDRYFLYVRRLPIAPGVVGSRVEVTTWTGQLLGYGRLGKYYTCGNSRRYSIRFTAINGIQYAGVYYASSGDYARVRKVKS